ncbi:hypothetical protein G6F56_013399 [Rhizopus delemar]|nr:hypothetical protein G6F56_013399 [Rhizopus delemar]
MGCTAYNKELNSIALTKAAKKNNKPSINEPVTETEELKTQETDGPVEEVDEFDFQDVKFRKLIEKYTQNYESDDDIDSVSASDSEPMEIDDETIVYNVEV